MQWKEGESRGKEWREEKAFQEASARELFRVNRNCYEWRKREKGSDRKAKCEDKHVIQDNQEAPGDRTR
jgi:hypothetical protein